MINFIINLFKQNSNKHKSKTLSKGDVFVFNTMNSPFGIKSHKIVINAVKHGWVDYQIGIIEPSMFQNERMELSSFLKMYTPEKE